MSDESWENGLRDVMTGTAVAARVVAPPTDVILRKGRSSLRRRNGLAGSGVLGVVAAAVIAGTSLAGGGSVSPAAAPTSARLPQAADAVVRMGPASAKTKVVLYEDYRCPVCKDLNAGLESALRQDAADGKIQIEYRPTDLIDRNEGLHGSGSAVAGNAVVCAADQGAFYAFRNAVYAHQTSEETDPFASPAQLVEIAREVPGLDTPAFKKCVDDLPYAAAVSRNFDTATNSLRCEGMPCVIADGQQWTSTGLLNQSLGAAVGSWLSGVMASH